MTRQYLLSATVLLSTICTVFWLHGANTNLEDPYADTYVTATTQDTLPPIEERFEDYITNPNSNPFDLEDPSAVEQTVEYDPVTGQYIVTERIGDILFRPPTVLTFDEFLELSRERERQAYFDELAGISTGNGSLSVDNPLADVDVGSSLLDRLFGGNTVDIQPQGSIDLTFGIDYQASENPGFTVRQQKNANFDFDMAIQMNVTGQIGEKLKLNTSYNTQATFNFDNQIKLDYNSDAFGEDDILKKIEAGNVSLPLRGTLIQGAQSLFGLKTELQFGHLRLTAVASQQQSQNENITIQGGSQVTEFEVKGDEYDENRHFFLSHYNRNSYEATLKNLPQMSTLFRLNPQSVEVWITNDRNEVTNTRDIIAFADLGEPDQANFTSQNIRADASHEYQEICDGRLLPGNGANELRKILSEGGEDSPIRDIDKTVAILETQYGLRQSVDFEKIRARKLTAREFTVHPELGFVSINVPVQPDQVLAVSYGYSYNQNDFVIGERAGNTDVTPTDTMDVTPKVLFTKMLKATTQNTQVPLWDLMMKNVYSIGAYQVNQEDFYLDVYYEEPGLGTKRFVPEGDINGIPLIRVMNLDKLNIQNDPSPDGIFDFVPGVTINPSNGRVIFPVLEPFGSHMADQFTDPALKEKYAYPELYDMTIFQARETPEKNRFVIKGSYKSSVASEISLGAFNIPQNSVRVTAGGQALVENVDFEVDYSTGRLRILNDAILSSGVPINVSFEDNTVFGLQNKTMLGLRADYEISEDINIGATFLQLFERPFTPKVNIGDDPINNRIYGLDFNISKDAPWLTRAVDKLPFYSTAEASSINFMAEAAVIDPGHAKAINQSKNDKGGIVYIDDFEGSASSIDLRQPTNQWFMASVPQKAVNNAGEQMFPEVSQDSLISGANRARINWYRIDDVAINNEDRNNPYTSTVPQIEVFPNRNVVPGQNNFFRTFDISYYPNERGPYNFDPPESYPGFTSGSFLEPTDTISPVKLRDPETRWGGIMRSLTTNDFQSSNIEFLEFWMLSPFHDEGNAREAAFDAADKQGTLYINFGNISEDILKDSRRFFENGLPSPENPDRAVDVTTWARVPVGQQITRAFGNDPASRVLQDVGLDGFDDAGERTKYSDYLSALEAANPVGAAIAANDLAADNFRFYNDGEFTSDDGVKTRYRRFNNTQGNSQPNTGNQFRQSGTNIPDAEDLDRDNTLNEAESYFQYEVPIRVNQLNQREIDMENTPYITDRIEDTNGTGRIWYRFRVPLKDPNERKAIGGIQDFRSIRFMRMYMKDFQKPVTLRFASLELVRNQWRRYSRSLGDPFELYGRDCDLEAGFQIDAVNIEENSDKQPFNYTLPSGIARERSLGVFNALQNEQSLAIRVDSLCTGGVKGVFKYTENDLRLYERLQMFVHAEERNEEELENGEMTMFIRLGNDFKENYYEYEIPLVFSREENLPTESTSEAYKEEVWRTENFFDIPLSILKELKIARNNDADASLTKVFEQNHFPEGSTARHTIKVKGNPNLGFAKVMMIGVRNPYQEDGINKERSIEVWANEMRLTGLDERGGLAALARLDMQMADLGTFTMAGNYNSIGFGALDQSVHERSRDQITGYDIATDLNLDKFLPAKWGIRLPFYAQRSNATSTPEFDPYDYDLTLKEKLDAESNRENRDSIRRQAQDITNITTYNFTNVGKERTGNSGGQPTPWDIENISVNYGYTKTERSDPLIESDVREEYTGGLDYTFSRSSKYIEPFKGLSPKYLGVLQKFNFNPLPNSFSFSTVLDRQFSTTSYRFSGVNPRFNTFYNKRFLWNRTYDLNWDFTRSLKFNFSADSNASIDEPDENAMLDDPTITDVRRFRKDSIWSSIGQLGRPKLYSHSLSLSYTLPLRYLPYMDWVQVRANYEGGYNWNAAALNVDSLGNVIQNNQNRSVNADLNFDKLYDKIPFLKKINSPNRRRSNSSRGSSRGRNDDTGDTANRGNRSRDSQASTLSRVLIRPLLLVRKLKVTYSEQFETVVPGFTPQTHLLGLSSGFDAPGWGFVAGLQPKIRTLDENWYGNNDWLYEASEKGWITENVFQGKVVTQNYTKSFDGRLTLEPFTDFKIEIEGNRSFTENYEESFKVTEKPDIGGGPAEFTHGSPRYNGSLNVSYNALNTMFKGSDAEADALFNQMLNYRPIISQRIGTGVHENPDLAAQGYTDGYGRSQQDVLIPAFIAAYTGQNPETMDLDVFATKFKPNWRLTYDGLSKIPAFREIFSRFTISHGYRSTLTISSFLTNSDYSASLTDPNSNGQDDDSYDFFTRIEIPNVTIQENFAPLFALEMETQNGMSFNFDYKQSRTLALSVISKSLSEARSKEFVAGFGYVLKDFNVGFLTGNKSGRGGTNTDPAPQNRNNRNGSRGGGRLETSDLDLQFNFSLRDDIKYTQTIDGDDKQVTGGTFALSISPSAEYQLNKSLSLRLFMDYRRTVPKGGQSYPRTDAAGGIVVRFQLN